MTKDQRVYWQSIMYTGDISKMDIMPAKMLKNLAKVLKEL